MRKVLYILGELEDGDLGWIIEAGELRKITSGSSIIRQGEDIGTLFIVLEGEFSVAADGRELARLGSGEVLGDMSLLDSRPPNATVTASGDSSVYAVSHKALRLKLANDQSFAARFYRALCIFLANRLSRTVTMVGNSGRAAGDAGAQDEDEISPDMLEKVSLAGARFNMFIEQVSNS